MTAYFFTASPPRPYTCQEGRIGSFSSPPLGRPARAFSALKLRFEAKQKAVLGRFLGSICVRLASKLRHSTTYNSFVCTKTLSSFRQKTSFLHFRAFFPWPDSFPFALPCLAAPPSGAFRSPSATTTIGYHKPVFVSRKKWGRQWSRWQASEVRCASSTTLSPHRLEQVSNSLLRSYSF
jgi:hypothetical protein